MHRLAAHDAGSLDLHATRTSPAERALAVDGFTDGVHHSAEQGVAHRHREDVTGRTDRLALLDLVDLAEHHGADRVLVEVEGQTDRAVLELEHLVDRRIRQT